MASSDYNISYVTLTHTQTKKTTGGDAGFANDRQELQKFLDGYKHYHHDQRLVILGEDLSIAYKTWQAHYYKISQGDLPKFLWNVGKFISSVASHNPYGVAKGVMRAADGILEDIARENAQPEDFMTLNYHYECPFVSEQFAETRIGIFLHQGKRGERFHAQGSLRWNHVSASLKGQRHI